MPYTLNSSASTPPYYVALTGVYAVITNIAADIQILNGVTQEPTIKVYYALYANEAAFKAGATPGEQLSVTVTSASPIMPQIESQLAAVLSALPGVSGVASANT